MTIPDWTEYLTKDIEIIHGPNGEFLGFQFVPNDPSLLEISTPRRVSMPFQVILDGLANGDSGDLSSLSAPDIGKRVESIHDAAY